MCAKKNKSGKGSKIGKDRRSRAEASTESLKTILITSEVKATKSLDVYAPKIEVKKNEVVLGVLPFSFRVRYARCVVMMRLLHAANQSVFSTNKRIAVKKLDRSKNRSLAVACEGVRLATHALEIATAMLWSSIRVGYPKSDFRAVAVRKGWKVVAYPDVENARTDARHFMTSMGLEAFVDEFSSPPFM